MTTCLLFRLPSAILTLAYRSVLTSVALHSEDNPETSQNAREPGLAFRRWNLWVFVARKGI